MEPSCSFCKSKASLCPALLAHRLKVPPEARWHMGKALRLNLPGPFDFVGVAANSGSTHICIYIYIYVCSLCIYVRACRYTHIILYTSTHIYIYRYVRNIRV